MRKLAALAALILLAFAITPAHADIRTEHRSYVGAAAAAAFPLSPCNGGVPSVGVACFPINGTETELLRVSIDDTSALPIVGHFRFFTTLGGGMLGDGTFCGSTSFVIPIPPNTTVIVVETGNAEAITRRLPDCAYPATTGTVTITYR